jgi:hypothetical protein
MVQRTPTYIGATPEVDHVAQFFNSPTHQPLEGSFAGFLFLLVVHHVSKEGKEICQGRNVQ